MISSKSRYSASTVTPGSSLAGNDIMVIQFTQPIDKTFTFTYHQVKANDYVDLLANVEYGDPTLWWIIANANPEVTDWMNLTVGSLIRIPKLTSLVAV
jgi:aryl-phospho-beta-D-glucosidase BglC (GH1 family)